MEQESEEGERTGRNPAGGRRQKHNHRILSKVWTGLRAKWTSSGRESLWSEALGNKEAEEGISEPESKESFCW